MTVLTETRPETEPPEDVAVPIPAWFALESGDALTDRHVQVRRFGARHGPQIVALGGISAGRDVCGETGWWRETIVDHAAIDFSRFGLIGVNFAPLADRRVRLSPRDQAKLIGIALDRLGVRALHAFVGASYGGLVGLALAAIDPARVERLVVISAAHRQSAQSLAWRGVQRRIVEFALAKNDPAAGLSLARQLAMITYRTPEEFEARFGAGVDAEGRGGVDRYLENRGDAYVGVSSPKRWLSLSEAIDRAQVDPRDIKAVTTLATCAEDQLVPIGIVRELSERLPRLANFHTLSSLYGHDAFLKEPAQVAQIIRDAIHD